MTERTGGRLSATQRARLAARLRRDRQDDPDAITRRPPGTAEETPSFGQEQLWFLDRYAPGSPLYNLPGAIRLTGPLDTAALHRALNALLARHEALRTRLVTAEDGRPRQIVDPPAPLPLPVTDLSTLDPDRAASRVAALAREDIARPFDLSRAPLLRARLVRLPADAHVLEFVVHHAAFDGWSANVFLDDLAALYAAEATGTPSTLADLPIQFADYARWERHHLTGDTLAELQRYWRTTLHGAETLQLPTDRPRPPLDSPHGAEEFRPLPPALLAGLRELARREGTTLYGVLLTGLYALLHRWTGQTDLVLGTVAANRPRAVLAPLIGYLVNTLPIRVDLSGDPTFTDLMARVRDTTVAAFAHQDLPFAQLVEAVRAHRDPSRTPVFQVMFSHVDRRDATRRAAGVDFAPADRIADAETAKFDIAFVSVVGDHEATLGAQYTTALFDASTVRRLLGTLETLLSGAVADPTARLSELPLLTDAERHRELVEWNDTGTDLPTGLVHGLFESQATRTPDAIAAECEDDRVTYADLNRRANRIAHALRARNVGPEKLVGVCLAPGPARIAALLGILKAGGGYVPLDPALPAERLSFLMSDAHLTAVLADDPSRPALPDTGIPVLSPAVTGPDTNPSDAGVQPSSAAYVIYTSGSTGRPKGVVVEHRHLVNYIHGLLARWHLGPTDVTLQFASLNFDASVMDIFMTLASGGRLLMAPTTTLHSPHRLAALIRARGATFACLPPAVLALLADEDLPSLRILLSGGEELPSGLARRLIRPGRRFHNSYGPTEATITATLADITADTPLPPPIGLPLPNYTAHVLDPNLNPVPVGVIGELHIGGAGVARGYLNRPDLTAERFIDNPFGPGRLYQTGDLVRRRQDGQIVFVGRTDHQVKLRGLRIELGEIETTLATHPSVAQAVVTVTTDRSGNRDLAAYLRPAGTTPPDPAALRAHLARTLPGYMIPAHLITVDAFPLNPSGKVDRAALPPPDAATPRAAAAPPATLTESILVDGYARLLDREHVGATDSFFDLGGNSLRAMQLVATIQADLGVDLPVTEVFLHPTPRQLAARVGTTAATGPLAPLSTGVGALPLILIHPVGGTVLGYTPLARGLAATFAVRGLPSPALSGAAIPAALTALVDRYVHLIRESQPTGPYRLAGWSLGGVLAFEVARALERSGAEVARLILLDAPFPTTTIAIDDPTAAFVADAARGLGINPAEAPPDNPLPWLATHLGDDTDHTILRRLRRGLAVFRAHTAMIATYRPAPPPVAAPTLIVSADASPNAPARNRWPTVLSGPTTTLRMPADHYTFLRPPLADELATAILKWHAT